MTRHPATVRETAAGRPRLPRFLPAPVALLALGALGGRLQAQTIVSSAPPLLHYDFDDMSAPTANGGTLGSAYDGLLSGDAAFVPFGSGAAVLFDGDSDFVLNAGDEDAFDLADGDFSVFARISTTVVDPSCGTAERGVVWKERVGGAAIPGWTFGVIKATGVIRLSLFTSTPSADVSLMGATPVNDGAPHEILGVRRGNAIELYVDGFLDGTKTLGSLPSTHNDNALVIGGRTLAVPGCTGMDDFDGVIDEVRIYDVAVDVVCDADVAALAPRNAGTNPASLSGGGFALGQPWTLAVDLGTTGHSFALPFAFDTALAVTLSGGQTLLCFDGGGFGELLGLSFASGPSAVFGGVVPRSIAYCGFAFSVQALHFGGTVPFALSNALDATVGN